MKTQNIYKKQFPFEQEFVSKNQADKYLVAKGFKRSGALTYILRDSLGKEIYARIYSINDDRKVKAFVSYEA